MEEEGVVAREGNADAHVHILTRHGVGPFPLACGRLRHGLFCRDCLLYGHATDGVDQRNEVLPQLIAADEVLTLFLMFLVRKHLRECFVMVGAVVGIGDADFEDGLAVTCLEVKVSGMVKLLVRDRSRGACRGAENLAGPYYKRVPLPWIPGYQTLDKQAKIAQSANTVHVSHWHEVV